MVGKRFLNEGKMKKMLLTGCLLTAMVNADVPSVLDIPGVQESNCSKPVQFVTTELMDKQDSDVVYQSAVFGGASDSMNFSNIWDQESIVSEVVEDEAQPLIENKESELTDSEVEAIMSDEDDWNDDDFGYTAPAVETQRTSWWQKGKQTLGYYANLGVYGVGKTTEFLGAGLELAGAGVFAVECVWTALSREGDLIAHRNIGDLVMGTVPYSERTKNAGKMAFAGAGVHYLGKGLKWLGKQVCNWANS